MTDTVKVKVRILEKEFQLACAEGEKKALMLAADHLNDCMAEVKSSGVSGLDKIAMLTALNLSNELLQLKGQHANSDDKITELSDKVARVLGK